jgi:hypothetical protein
MAKAEKASRSMGRLRWFEQVPEGEGLTLVEVDDIDGKQPEHGTTNEAHAWLKAAVSKGMATGEKFDNSFVLVRLVSRQSFSSELVVKAETESF